MAGYQTLEALRPILHRGPVAAPVVNRTLVYKPPRAGCPTYAQIQRMIELRQKGQDVPSIARQVGFGETTVYRHTKHVQLPAGYRPMTGRKPRYNRARVEQLHGWGFSYDDIAAELGCHRSTVGQILNGWTKKTKRRPVLFRPQRLFDIVSRITGVSTDDLRAAGLKSHGSISKARIILQWLVRHKRPDLSFVSIGKLVGGFDHTSCSRSYRTVCAVIEALNIGMSGNTDHIVRRLWAAEWPKVSR